MSPRVGRRHQSVERLPLIASPLGGSPGERAKTSVNLWILWKTQDRTLWNLWITCAEPLSAVGGLAIIAKPHQGAIVPLQP